MLVITTKRQIHDRILKVRVNGDKDARAKVRKLARAGVDCIKLIDQDQMSMDEIQAIVDEAHLNKLKVIRSNLDKFLIMYFPLVLENISFITLCSKSLSSS